MNLINRLLRRNISPARIAGFIISCFLGLAIIVGGLQFYGDARSLWASDDSFINNDILVVNKRVTAAGTWDASTTAFTPEEIADIEAQPWVREVGAFRSTDYRVWASVGQGGRGLSTMLFFESVPDRFVDVAAGDFRFTPGDSEVPIIISKDYLALYNFGFAGSAGLPQMSENILTGIPLRLTLTSEDGRRVRELNGRVAGLSNRLNTILVPESFMQWSNDELGAPGRREQPSRLVIDVSSPGDVAIKDYLEAHGLEVAGDKSGSSASYLLNVITGIVLAIGIVITLLSLFILLLSISLLMEKNRDKLHALLMLGCEPRTVAAPYIRIVVAASLLSYALAIAAMLALRSYYLAPLRALGAAPSSLLPALLTGLLLTSLLIIASIASIRRRSLSSFR